MRPDSSRDGDRFRVSAGIYLINMDDFDPGFDDGYDARPGPRWASWTAEPTRSQARPQLELEVVPTLWNDDSVEAATRPRRRRLLLIIAAAAIAAAVLLWWLLRPHHTPPATTITPATPTTTTALAESPTQTEEVVPTSNTPPPTGQPATGPAASVAGSFAADYVNIAGGKDAWFSRISQWTTPQLADGYRLTDPSRLPDAVFEHLSPPLDSDSGTVIYDATYTTMTLEIRVVFVDNRWLVSAALDAGPRHEDSSPPGSTPVPTTPYLPPDIGAPPTH